MTGAHRPIISADSHVIEPVELWDGLIPIAWWGDAPAQFSTHAGGFDPKARIDEMETVTLSAPGIGIVEQNFDYDLLSPDTLMNKAVGQQIRIVRTNPGTGQQITETATVLAVNNGVVLQIGDRIEVLRSDGVPTRVIFDRRARIPENSRVFSTLSAGPVIMIVSEAAVRSNPARVESLERRGVTFERWGDQPLQSVLTQLGARDVLSLLVEGGPTLQQSFVDSGLVDRVQWVETPKKLTTGVRPVVGQRLKASGSPATIELGDDVLTEFDVHGID